MGGAGCSVAAVVFYLTVGRSGAAATPSAASRNGCAWPAVDREAVCRVASPGQSKSVREIVQCLLSRGTGATFGTQDRAGSPSHPAQCHARRALLNEFGLVYYVFFAAGPELELAPRTVEPAARRDPGRVRLHAVLLPFLVQLERGIPIEEGPHGDAHLRRRLRTAAGVFVAHVAAHLAQLAVGEPLGRRRGTLPDRGELGLGFDAGDSKTFVDSFPPYQETPIRLLRHLKLSARRATSSSAPTPVLTRMVLQGSSDTPEGVAISIAAQILRLRETLFPFARPSPA